MKKIIIPIVLIAFYLLLQSFTLSRAPIQEGSIIYEVVDVESDKLDPISKMMVSGSELTISFQDQKMRTEMKLPFIKNTTIIDGKTRKGLALVEKFASKVAVPIDQTYFDQQEAERGKLTIIPQTERKTIAGFLCKKAIIQAENGGEMEMYYSEQIHPQQADNRFSFEGLNGFPLQMDMVRDGKKLKMKAKKVNIERRNKYLFSLDVPKGYSIKGIEYLLEMRSKWR